MATLPYKFSIADADTRKADADKAKTFQCLVVSPDGKIFEDHLDYVQAPGKEGSFGVLAHHSPFISILKQGTVTLKSAGRQLSIQIPAGILEVNGLHDVLILCDSAELATVPGAEASSHN